MTHTQTRSLDHLLRVSLTPNNTAAPAEVLLPSVETCQSSFDASRQAPEPFRLIYNEERLEFLANLADQILLLSENKEAWGDYLDELEEWSCVVGDGLEDDEVE